ncbi:MAG: class II fumarate hydratase [Vicinamibacterales bacterium]
MGDVRFPGATADHPPARVESDSLGTVPIPSGAYWGAQTERSRLNFPIGGDAYRFAPGFIRALGLVKLAAAGANRTLGALDAGRAVYIATAAREVADGAWDAQFPLVVFQTGSGTHTNMNANEVIANRAIELAGGVIGTKAPIHPNDHVNRSQSSNDVIPTCMHVAVAAAVHARLFPALARMTAALDGHAAHYARLIKVGRTHLQDAAPITLGFEFSGWSAQVSQAREGIARALGPVYELALGATAVGTGLNAPAGFGPTAIAELATLTGLPFVPSRHRLAAIAAHDALVGLSGSVRVLAGALLKVANDIRWLGSGPRAGLGELQLPANEPGSSIMPGKINPSQAEALTMVAVHVFGADHAVAFAGSQGAFELNAYKPLIAHHLLDAVSLLADACESFVERCLAGLTADEAAIGRQLERSLVAAAALVPHVGYDLAARIALDAHRSGRTLRESALALQAIAAEDFDRWTRLDTAAGVPGAAPDPAPPHPGRTP